MFIYDASLSVWLFQLIDETHSESGFLLLVDTERQEMFCQVGPLSLGHECLWLNLEVSLL